MCALDKYTLKILKYIAENDPVSEMDIISELGENAELPLGYLVECNFVTRNWEPIGKFSHCDMVYRTAVDGRAYLEEKPGDRKSTRLNSSH